MTVAGSYPSIYLFSWNNHLACLSLGTCWYFTPQTEFSAMLRRTSCLLACRKMHDTPRKHWGSFSFFHLTYSYFSPVGIVSYILKRANQSNCWILMTRTSCAKHSILKLGYLESNDSRNKYITLSNLGRLENFQKISVTW